MRLNKLLTWMAAPLIAVAPLKSTAQTWQTVDDFQVAPGLNAAAGDIGTDPSGSILYSVGGATDVDGVRAGVVRVSTDSGQSWTTVDALKVAGWPTVQYRGFGSAASGALFTAGELYDSVGGFKNWIVRRSLDGGLNWTTQDVFVDGPQGWPTAADIKVAPSGAIFASGQTAANDGASGWYWLVRRSLDGGNSWVTVDKVLGGSEARMTGFHPNGSVFVVGGLADSRTGLHWTVRRSTNGGATWTTVDSYQAAAGIAARAESVAVDASGTIYVAGMASGTQKGKGPPTYTLLWVVRRSTDGGASWSGVDNLTLASGNTTLSGPTGIAIAPSGLLYVCGYTPPIGTMPNHWLVRRGTPGANGAIACATDDDFQLAAGQSAQPWAITSDAFGSILVSGRANDGLGTQHWITRRLLAAP